MIIAANAALGRFYSERRLFRSCISHLNNAIGAARNDAMFPLEAIAHLERMLANAYLQVGDSQSAGFALHRVQLPPALCKSVDKAIEEGLQSTEELTILADTYANGPFEVGFYFWFHNFCVFLFLLEERVCGSDAFNSIVWVVLTRRLVSLRCMWRAEKAIGICANNCFECPALTRKQGTMRASRPWFGPLVSRKCHFWLA